MDITFSTQQGLREYQEDRFLVHQTPHGSLLAIFDGHCGAAAAERCFRKLPEIWDARVMPDDIPSTLLVVFDALDIQTKEMRDGTTASLVFIPIGSKIVHVAILGDSPVLVKTPDSKWSVSPEHNVRTNSAERQAAEGRGGTYYGGYIYNGQSGLQMSRALGDAPLRKILSQQPDIYQVESGGIVLLATDGVFDPAHQNSEKEIVAVTRLIGEGASAAEIVDRAIKNQTGDNATAILGRL